MPGHKHRLLVPFFALAIVMIFTVAPAHAQSAATPTTTYFVYLPLLARSIAPPADLNSVPDYVNYFRTLAGVPTVTFSPTLDSNCWYHARYMAENEQIGHTEDSGNPWYSAAGLTCAQSGNAWLGGRFFQPYWQPRHSIEGWMASTGHRLWLLYPTTPTFGYGFYTASDNAAGAALDVLSTFNSAADTAYAHWPVRYPAAGQTGIPATTYPITLNWRYFGPTPTLTASTITTTGGQVIAHTANTSLPAGHKGIELRPTSALPANTTFTVTITGTYSGAPFTYTWQFTTGN